MYRPAGLAFNTLGNLYVAKSGRRVMRKIAPSGLITIVAGAYIPVAGDRNGDAKNKVGTYPNGFWVLDRNGNGMYDGAGPGGDRFVPFGGATGSQPIAGRW